MLYSHNTHLQEELVRVHLEDHVAGVELGPNADAVVGVGQVLHPLEIKRLDRAL